MGVPFKGNGAKQVGVFRQDQRRNHVALQQRPPHMARTHQPEFPMRTLTLSVALLLTAAPSFAFDALPPNLWFPEEFKGVEAPPANPLVLMSLTEDR